MISNDSCDRPYLLAELQKHTDICPLLIKTENCDTLIAHFFNQDLMSIMITREDRFNLGIITFDKFPAERLSSLCRLFAKIKERVTKVEFICTGGNSAIT